MEIVYLSVNKVLFWLSFDYIKQVNSEWRTHSNDLFEASALASDFRLQISLVKSGSLAAGCGRSLEGCPPLWGPIKLRSFYYLLFMSCVRREGEGGLDCGWRLQGRGQRTRAMPMKEASPLQTSSIDVQRGPALICLAVVFPFCSLSLSLFLSFCFLCYIHPPLPLPPTPPLPPSGWVNRVRRVHTRLIRHIEGQPGWETAV